MALVTTLIFDPTTKLAVGAGSYDYEPTLGPSEAVCTPAQFASPKQWKLVNGAIVAATAADLASTQAQLAENLVTAASAACGAVTSQIVPDQTHQIAYSNALALVGPSATVPTADPAKTAFLTMAAANGFGTNAQGFATLAVGVAAASLTLSGILTTLESAVAIATTSAQLASALSAFETALTALVTSLNSAGLTITIIAPPAITIVGINA